MSCTSLHNLIVIWGEWSSYDDSWYIISGFISNWNSWRKTDSRSIRKIIYLLLSVICQLIRNSDLIQIKKIRFRILFLIFWNIFQLCLIIFLIKLSLLFVLTISSHRSIAYFFCIFVFLVSMKSKFSSSSHDLFIKYFISVNYLQYSRTSWGDTFLCLRHLILIIFPSNLMKLYI